MEPVGHVGAFSPDGKTLASLDDETVRLWDVHTGELKHALTGHSGTVKSVAFSLDGQTVASAVERYDELKDGKVVPKVAGEVRLWDAQTGQLKRTLTGLSGWGGSVAVSPDGKRVAIGSLDLKMWDIQTGAVQWTQTLPHTVSQLAFAPDGNALAAGSSDHTVRLWDLRTGELKRTVMGHRGAVFSLAFSPDGKMLVSGSKSGDLLLLREPPEGEMKLWHVETGELQRRLAKDRSTVSNAILSPDGKTVATDSGGDMNLWDFQTGELKQTLSVPNDSVSSKAFSPDGKTLAGGTYNASTILWDVRTGAVQRRIAGHSGAVVLVAFSPDGRLLACADSEEAQGMRPQVGVWEVLTGKLKWQLGSGVTSLAFSPDGTTLAGGTDERQVMLWDAHTGKRTQSWQSHRRSSVAFSSDGRLLVAGGGDHSVELWNVASGQLVAILMVTPPGKEGEVSTDWIAFTPAGYYHGSSRAARFIRWRIGSKLFPAEAYERTFHRAALVQQALQGKQ